LSSFCTNFYFDAIANKKCADADADADFDADFGAERCFVTFVTRIFIFTLTKLPESLLKIVFLNILTAEKMLMVENLLKIDDTKNHVN